MAEIVLEQLTKVYPDGTQAVDGLSLDVTAGEFVVFVGPSGCGKTTALRMIAGLETVTSGNVLIDGQVVNDLPPKDRDIAMVFQNYALYPHMNAAKNMGFALKLRGVPKAEVDRRVREAAQVLGLTDSLGKKPRTLSGGQRQRVAMGRAIVRNPQAFLMDEPLSNLDAKLRVEMRAEISRIQRRPRGDDDLRHARPDRGDDDGGPVAVMRSGVLQQVAQPTELYDRPRNLFVAEFIGSPAMNVVKAELERVNGDLCVAFGGHRLRLEPTMLAGSRRSTRSTDAESCSGSAPRTWRTRRPPRCEQRGPVPVCHLRHPRGHGVRGLRALQHRGRPRGDDRRWSRPT